MSRPRSPIVALAIGFLTAPVLGAQTATDLADVCKVVGNAKPGQWASFDATNGGSEAGKVRLAVVGSEQAGDTTLYWFEVSFIGKDPGHSGVVQILNPSLAAGVAAPRGLVVKMGGQPAMKIPGPMATLMGKQAGQNTSAFDWAARCSGAHVVGWESVTVPAGTFRTLHVATDDGAEVWGSRDVPFGLVKTHGRQGDMALTARGSDAKSSITEKPLDMPGMMMPKP